MHARGRSMNGAGILQGRCCRIVGHAERATDTTAPRAGKARGDHSTERRGSGAEAIQERRGDSHGLDGDNLRVTLHHGE